ncbi:IclR family transcriptional regulator [Halobiforma nitratireducens]|uniref:IclR family transcriptional regulator n=1 Tax=Halobiforma nitratireducens JCM 10879 TaxID=1227454 RepID=M0M6L0_9EURY|nr:IclR family transcriptional regulator [Halobiforma nitratireducens]EMA41013.1 IclR family transcriptional regulator [Halobiforma nitratireducens JCM 10879]
MGSNSDEGAGIKATETTFAIVETLADLERARLTEIADAVGIANSTASDHLRTLREHGYVVADDEGYRLGLAFMDTGTRAKRYYRDLLEAADPVLEQLVEETNETVNLVAEENGEGVYVDRRVGERGVPTDSWVGRRKPLHTISAGKAILAELSEQRRDDILDHGLAAPAERTITDRAELEAELASVRDDGVAFNDRESHGRIRAVGSPIVLEDEVDAAVSVAGPAKRLTDDYFREEIPSLLQGAVNEIELKLTYR